MSPELPELPSTIDLYLVAIDQVVKCSDQLGRLMAGTHKSSETNEIEEAGVEGSPNQSPIDSDMASLDADLALIAAAWPVLPEAIKAGIVAMVQAASSPPPQTGKDQQ